jgi:hypothetical protein
MQFNNIKINNYKYCVWCNFNVEVGDLVGRCRSRQCVFR